MAKNEFVVEDKKYMIKPATAKQNNEARRIYNRAFSEATKDDCMLRDQIIGFARERGILTEESEAKTSILRKEMVELEDKLALGGIELEEAKEVALRLQEVRAELLVNSAVLTHLLSNSAERQAEAARDDYLMSVCICNHAGVPVCKSLDDFLARQDDPVITAGVEKYNEVVYGLSSNFIAELPENKFLIDYGFMNSDLQMLDESGNPIVVEQPERKPFLKNGEPVTPKVVEVT